MPPSWAPPDINIMPGESCVSISIFNYADSFSPHEEAEKLNEKLPRSHRYNIFICFIYSPPMSVDTGGGLLTTNV